MDHIDELEPTALERSLHDRLHHSAAAATPDPDALGAVRARAAGRRRRSRMAVLVASAAAVTLIAAGAVLVTTRGNGSTGLAAGPSGDPAAIGAEPAAPAGPAAPNAPTSSAPPVAVPDGDATLVIFRYPNATPEMLAEDPLLGGEWARLHLADRTCHANGPLDELGGNSPCAESRAGEILALIDAGAPPTDLSSRGSDGLPYDLMGALQSGMASPAQVARILDVLETLPDVTVSEADGGDTVTIALTEPEIAHTQSLTIDAVSGHPLWSRWSTDPTLDVEYLSITRVRSADYLVPGRGTPLATSTTTTTTPVGAEGPG